MGICHSRQHPTIPKPPPLRKETTEDFGSTRVNIRIDTRTDENKILNREQGYPDPTPAGHLHGTFPRKSHWFTDDKFNNASDDADLFKTEIAVDDDDIDLDKLSDEVIDDVNPKRIRPASSIKPSLSYDLIDDHAKKAGQHLIDSFQELIQYLTAPLKADKFPKIKTARAIVVWLSQQKMEGISYGEKNMVTPRGLLQYLKEERMTYTTCYTILCRKAGLQCVIIKGHVKAAGYEPGDDVVPESSWNAIHVECGWQIVHPYWICRTLFGFNLGGWIKVEKDGTTMNRKEQVSAGIKRDTFKEYYFMPNPEEFIYRCCAFEKEWQLVPQQSVVPSLAEFLKKPCLFIPFFGTGLRLVSEPKCVLNSQDGFCKIEMKARSANAHMIVLKYELFIKELEAETFTSLRKEEWSRMVFNSRAGETFSFEIRFPKTGIFKLVIYGGPYKSAVIRLSEFKLICEQEMTGRNLLPLGCDDIGWGPGPVSVEAGLLMPSKPSGLIPVNEKEKKTEIKFQLRDMSENYSAVVHGEVGGRRKQLDDGIVDIKKNKQLHQIVIAVIVPEKGEYGLSIYRSTIKMRDKQGRNVCNYLVSTLAYKCEHANVKNAKQKLRDSVAATVEPRKWKQQISDIQNCIERCKKERVADSDDEIIASNAMVWFLTCKDKLRDCILRRNLHVIKKTLAIVSLYKNQDALTREVKEVKELEKEIVALRGFARQVPKFEEANKEIIALKHASEEVYNTLKALLVLLGETEQTLEGWSNIQSRMKASTHTVETSILGKMGRIQKEEISQGRLARARDILYRFKEDQVRKVNSDAHSFYVWTENVINIHDGK